MSDQQVNTVYKTTDYEQFNFHENNRSVNPSHKQKLKASIKKSNLLAAQPITVNESGEIIDGQHRFTCAKELKLPIYYIRVEGLRIDDAITLNVNTKNWHWQDYLRYWIDQGNEEYIYFQLFLEKYEMNYSVSVGLLGLGRATSGNELTDIFNSGKFKAKNKDYAEDIGNRLHDLQQYGSFATDRSFVLAFDDVMRMEGFRYNTFINKVQMAPDRFTKCTNTESYLRMMEDVYNYHNKGKRVRLY